MVVVWLVTTTALLVGLMTVGVNSAAGNDYEIVAIEQVDSIGSAPVQPADQFPSVLHAGVVWSLAEARLIPRSEGQFSKPIVVAEVFAANVTEDTPLRVRHSDLFLADPDGRLHPSDRFENTPTESRSRVVVEPGQTIQATVVFKPGIFYDPDLDEMALHIAEPKREPAVLPLVGPAPSDPYPLEGTIDAEPTVVPDPDRSDRQLVVTPQSAEIDLNYGAYRAPVGQRLNVIEVSVQRASSDDDAGFFDPDFWQLDVGDQQLQPIRVSKSDSPAANEDEVTLLFVFTAGPTDMTLTAGANGTAPAAFAMSVPDYFNSFGNRIAQAQGEAAPEAESTP